MLRLSLLVFILHVVMFSSQAQGVWTWMNGDTLPYPRPAVYGTQHVAGPSTMPSTFGFEGAMYETDSKGIFWAFGGNIHDTIGAGCMGGAYGNRLWSFNPYTNQWTWHSGTPGACGTGIYGTMGVPCSTCEPPAPFGMGYSWVDTADNLWFYYLVSNAVSPAIQKHREMWMYNTNTHEWTWVRRDTMMCDATNNYCNNLFLPNTYSSNLLPFSDLLFYGGSGAGKQTTWTLPNNELLLGIGVYKQFWKYSPVLNQWAWVTGYGTFTSPGTGTYFGPRYQNNLNTTYGHVGSSTCAPMQDGLGRILFCQFSDGSIGGVGAHNIIRRFTPSTNLWAWVQGDTSSLFSQRYGNSNCQGDTNNKRPQATVFTPLSAQSKVCQDNVWIYGGNGTNELWSFNLQDYKLTWRTGDTAGSPVVNFPTHYGTKGVPSPLNNPPPDGATVMWCDTLNNVWIYNGAADAGTMWRYQPDATCMGFFISSNNLISPPADTIMCYGDSILYSIDSSYKQVQFIPNTGASFNPNTYTIGLSPSATTTYTVVGTRYSPAGCSRKDTTRFTIVVIPPSSFSYPTPSFSSLCAGSHVSYAVPPPYEVVSLNPNTGYTTNSDTSVIHFAPVASTTYTLVAGTMGTNGCKAYDTVNFTITVLPTVTPVLTAPSPDTLYCDNEVSLMTLDPSYQVFYTPVSHVTPNSDTSLLSFSPDTTTTYTVTATAPPPCGLSKSLTFTLYTSGEWPRAIFGFDPDPVPLSNPQTILRNYSQHAKTFTWLYNGNVISTQGNGGVLKFSEIGKFCVTLIACANSCCDTTTNCGEVYDDNEFIAVPNAFSPNGDGLNDRFRVVSSKIIVEEFTIYNRWGQQVYFSTRNEGWDGTYKDKRMAQDTYYYFIRYRTSAGEQKLLKGDVILLR